MAKCALAGAVIAASSVFARCVVIRLPLTFEEARSEEGWANWAAYSKRDTVAACGTWLFLYWLLIRTDITVLTKKSQSSVVALLVGASPAVLSPVAS